ncbi:protein outspread isoform X2 [Phlebotomus papatasi]|uniref:protein outspread isoform X2 n=1 Tax=Phlebotomus papatasi TaxID=29031 RepID=UPI00248463A1|nr:protein outspread isoform X2 [Phlebotomus papatasi]
MSRNDCRKFSANIFNVSKCSHCFRQREEHSLKALESNRSTRKVTKCGYLFVAPDWDFITNPLYRTKRWQRRWFVLYDDGDLTYSVDEHPETIPQACIDMSSVVEVTWAEEITGHLYSLAIRCPDKVTFVKGTCSEESNWWFNVLAAFPKIKVRTKRTNKLPSGGMYGNQDKARFSLPDVENQREEKVPNLGNNSLEEYFCKSSSRPISLPISSNAPAIVSAIVKGSGQGVNLINNKSSPLSLRQTSNHERGDPDGCNLDSESTANFMSESLIHEKKGWLMKLDNKSREWSKHWFTLRGAALFFYRDPSAETKGVLDGVIDVNSLIEVVPVSVSRNYAFQLTTWEKNQITLSAIADSVRCDWIKLLRVVAGITSKTTEKPSSRNPYELIENTSLEKDILLSNKSDDLKSEIEKDLMKTQQRYKNKNRIYALNKTIIQTHKGPGGSVKSTGTSPKINYSSDEEYGTASEGRHPDSFGFVSPMSPSSPVIETKERTSSRSSSRAGRFNKRSLSSPPSSRRSTMDSIRFDDAIISSSVDDDMEISSILRSRLATVEKDLWIMREEAEERETRMTELLRTLDKTESELSTRIKEAEDARDCLAIELQEKTKQADALYEQQKSEIENYKQMINSLEDRLNRGIDENDILYKKLQDIENSGPSSLCSLSRYKMKRVDSLSDLTNLNDIDPYTVERDTLADEYRELKQRFEKAVNEIRLMKRELKESQNQYDNLEISHVTLQNDIDKIKKDKHSQLNMMAARIQDLTFKYLSADRQNRVLKQKIAKTEKRRSLSLKGKDAFSIPKEFEEKITELEMKIDKIEAGDLGVQEHKARSITKIRRKSLDDDVNSVKPVEQILRLNSLERRVNNLKGKARDSSTAKINRKVSDHSIERLKNLEEVVVLALRHVEHSLKLIQERQEIPTLDNDVEKNLQVALEVLKNACESCVSESTISCEGEKVKEIVEGMEVELREKLSQLLNQRHQLRAKSQLTHEQNMKLLAERIGFESVLFSRLHKAISGAETPSTRDDHLIYAEVMETIRLMTALRKKLDGEDTVVSLGNSCVDVLTKVLCRRLLLTANRCRDYGDCAISITLPSTVIDNLKRQRDDLQVVLADFKAQAMEKLAMGLAVETLDSISNNKAINDASQQAWQHAQMVVNNELIRSEISQVFRNCVNQYQNMTKPDKAVSISFSQMKCFEHFSDTVGIFLREEVDSTLVELMSKHQEVLEKIQKGELKKKSQSLDGRRLLIQLADICAHRAIIDARISVLSGQYTVPSMDDMIPTRDTNTPFKVPDIAKYEDIFYQMADDLNFSTTSLIVEADWNFFGRHVEKIEENFVSKHASTMTETDVKSVSTESELQQGCDECEENREKLSNLGKQHEDSINDICQSYSYTVEVLKQKLEDEQHINENYRSENMKIIQQLKELTIKRETRKTELMEMTEKLNDISYSYKTTKSQFSSDEVDSKSPQEEYECEKSHLFQLEKHLKVVNEGDERAITPEKQKEDSLRKRYQSEIEQLRALCEKGLVAMESSHRRIINELEKKHQQELQAVLCEKEQALAEETQATLAALDAMRKAHQSEVQREIARFKQDFMKQFQKGGYNSMAMEHKEKEQELEEVRQEILSLSEKFSMKCVETASLEERIQHLTRQLLASQQQVQQLKSRDYQMESHLLSMKDERKLEDSKNA